LHIGVPSIIPRHFLGMLTSRSALRDMPLRRESLVVGKRGPCQQFELLTSLHVTRTLIRAAEPLICWQPLAPYVLCSVH
jgi:hypothetical protein